MKIGIKQYQINQERVYTKSVATNFVYTSSTVLVLALLLGSCKTPSSEMQLETLTHSSGDTETLTSGGELDTTTIEHHKVDSTTTVTKIIRRTIYENTVRQRSNNDSTATVTNKARDTITPELIKTIIKGFAVACIGVGLMVLGFLITVVIFIGFFIKNR